MTITPADIEAQQFPIVFRGYKVEAVDVFLDRVQQELAGTSGEPASTAPAAGTADRSAAHASVPTDAEHPVDGETGHAARALRTLVRAEQMAEQLTADAAAEVEEIRARAQVEAETIVAAARAKSSLLVRTQQLRARSTGSAGSSASTTTGCRHCCRSSGRCWSSAFPCSTPPRRAF